MYAAQSARRSRAGTQLSARSTQDNSNLSKGLSARLRVELDHLVETDDLEERLGVHALRAREVGAGVLERRHRRTDAVNRGDAADEREDCRGRWLTRAAR